jgi:hypothetical protein
MLSPMLLEILRSYAGTTTDTGLKVRAELDDNKYPKGGSRSATLKSRRSICPTIPSTVTDVPRPRKILAKGEVDLLIYGHA